MLSICRMDAGLPHVVPLCEPQGCGIPKPKAGPKCPLCIPPSLRTASLSQTHLLPSDLLQTYPEA